MILTQKEKSRLASLAAMPRLSAAQTKEFRGLVRKAGLPIRAEDPAPEGGGDAPAAATITCPECGHEWESSAEGEVTCPNCGAVFTPSAAEEPPPASDAPAARRRRSLGARAEDPAPEGGGDAPAAATITCPECGHEWESSAEGEVTCPNCGAVFTPSAAEEPPPASDAPAARNNGFLGGARAALANKRALLAQNSDMRARLGMARAEMAQLEHERDSVRAENASLRAALATVRRERNEAQAALDEALGLQKSVAAAVVDAQASLGVPKTKVPAPAKDGGGSRRDTLLAQFAQSTDASEKARIFAEIKKLDAKRGLN